MVLSPELALAARLRRPNARSGASKSKGPEAQVRTKNAQSASDSRRGRDALPGPPPLPVRATTVSHALHLHQSGLGYAPGKPSSEPRNNPDMEKDMAGLRLSTILSGLSDDRTAPARSGSTNSPAHYGHTADEAPAPTYSHSSVRCHGPKWHASEPGAHWPQVPTRIPTCPGESPRNSPFRATTSARERPNWICVNRGSGRELSRRSLPGRAESPPLPQGRHRCH